MNRKRFAVSLTASSRRTLERAQALGHHLTYSDTVRKALLDYVERLTEKAKDEDQEQDPCPIVDMPPL